MTVNVVVPRMAPCVARMVVLPAATPVARPRLPAALLIVAVAGVSDSQRTSWVMSCCVALEYEPVAVYCAVVPARMVPLTGVTEIDVNVADVTDMVVVPVTPSNEAVMVTPVPGLTPVANPSLPAALLMLATAELLDPQLTDAAVRGPELPSE